MSTPTGKVKVVRVERKSPLLAPSSLGCLSQTPTVSLTMGCAHGCLYCYTRGYRAYPGEGTVCVYTNVVDLLRRELERKRQKPRAVYFSPASDLFQPVPEVLDLAYEVLQELFARGIAVAFLTKGVIPERHMALLREHAALVHAQVGLITPNEAVLQMFEPGAPPATVRMAQVARLVAGGIQTQLRIDPILPAVTDDAETFRELCRSAREAGVTEAAASVLFLRPALARRLQQASKTNDMVAACLAAFGTSQRMAIRAEHSSTTVLPVEERKRIFSRLEQEAAACGIRVKRCACKNPDIARGTCSIVGEGLAPRGDGQVALFE